MSQPVLNLASDTSASAKKGTTGLVQMKTRSAEATTLKETFAKGKIAAPVC